MKSSAIFVSVFLAAIVFAGCVSDGGEQAGDDAPSGGQAAVTKETGGIEGTVVSEEGLPVAGATVGIPQVEASATTDAEGRFALSQLAPGVYQLFVQKIGFESRGLRADVRAGEVTAVEVQLAAVAIAEARHTTVIWNGYMKCSISTQLFLSEECGEGVGTPVGTFGKDPNNKIDWDFEQLEPPASLLTETLWAPASQFAGRMNVLVVTNLVCDPVCGWDEEYGRNASGPPVRIEMKDKVFPDDPTVYPLSLTVRHWADAGDEQLVVVLEQAFEVYKTEFFGVPMEDVDPTFTAIPPA